MMRRKRLRVLVKASCFWLDYKLKGVTPIILITPPQPMTRIVPTHF